MLTPSQFALLAEWFNAVKALAATKKLVEDERALRAKVMAEFFPDPKEGVNYLDIDDGHKLMATHSLDRKVDPASIDAQLTAVREQFNITTDDVVRRPPELNVKEYKTLPEGARKLIDLALTIKPKSPTIEIVKNKEAK